MREQGKKEQIDSGRREFLRKAVIGGCGLALGIYTLPRYLAGRYSGRYSLAFQNDAPEKLWKYAREADFYEKFSDHVVCKLCPHECTLGSNDRGFCRTRVNMNNKLYTVAYSNLSAVHLDPVEKKPLYHFLPGSAAFSVAISGCNFRCLNCQNWQISQSRPEDTQNIEMTPEQVVEAALNSGADSIAYTYSEPSAFYEYMLDTARLAHRSKLRNLWITNGYLNEKPLKRLAKYLDGANVDLKGFTNAFYVKVCSGTLQPVLNTLRILKESDVWLEVTNLIVPGYTDNLDNIKKLCDWLVRNIGRDYPLHFSRFHPAYRLTALPYTPMENLVEAREIAVSSGLNYIYIGNVPDNINPGKNTYCPNDKTLCIERKGFSSNVYMKNGRCPQCGQKIKGVWS